jgi:hypothetical protein
MPAMRDHIQAYVQRPEKQRLQREAAARGISVSQCVTDCLREYFAWREEMAAAIDNPGRPGDAHQGGPIRYFSRVRSPAWRPRSTAGFVTSWASCICCRA